jgi:hypothetical protein
VVDLLVGRASHRYFRISMKNYPVEVPIRINEQGVSWSTLDTLLKKKLTWLVDNSIDTIQDSRISFYTFKIDLATINFSIIYKYIQFIYINIYI